MPMGSRIFLFDGFGLHRYKLGDRLNILGEPTRYRRRVVALHGPGEVEVDLHRRDRRCLDQPLATAPGARSWRK
jgi:hypothetical protein